MSFAFFRLAALLLCADPKSNAAADLYEGASPTPQPLAIAGDASFVGDIAFSATGTMWVGTQRGLYDYDGRSWNKLAPPGHAAGEALQVTALAVGTDGTLWVGTASEGLFAYRQATWKHWRTAQGLPSDNVRALVIGDGELAYVGTAAGLTQLHWLDDRIAVPPNAFTHAFVFRLERREQQVWAATTGAGVFVYRGAGEIAHYTMRDGLPSDAAYALYADGERMWVGTELGLAIIDNGKVRRADDPGLKTISSIAGTVDARGDKTIWVADFNRGLAMRQHGRWHFIDDNAGQGAGVLAMRAQTTATHENVLWLSLQKGLFRLQPQSFRVFNEGPKFLREQVMAVHVQAADPGARTLWLATAKTGVHAYTGAWTTPSLATAFAVAETPAIPGLLFGTVGASASVLQFLSPSGAARSFASYPSTQFEDISSLSWSESSHALWVGHRNGVRRWSSSDATWSSVTIPGKPESVRVTGGVTETRDGQLWVATENGLFVRKGETWREFQREKIGSFYQCRPIEQITPAGDFVWLMTEAAITRVRLSDDSLQSLNLADGFALQVLEDGSDLTLWVLTQTAVLHLSAEGDSFRVDRFTPQDGLKDFHVTWGGMLELDVDGRLWAGSDAGLAVFDTRAAFPDRSSKPLRMDATRVNGSERPSLSHLGSSENSLSFDYSLRSYFRDQESRFQTQLVGLDPHVSEWVTESHREFPRLPPGGYVFKVWGRDYAGNVSGPLQSAFVIPTPPWRTWWASLVYLGALFAAVYGGTRARIAQLRRRAEELELMVDKRTEEVRAQSQEILAQKEELERSYKETDRIFDALKQALKGRLLDEKYQLEDEIGEGGFGVVYRATMVRSGTPCAIKVFRPASGNDSVQALERFKQEGKAGVRFRHPNAIRIDDFAVSPEGVAYMVMELLHGESLKQALTTRGKFSSERSCFVAIGVCRALAAAHAQGIVHRDIKPDNVFLSHAPEASAERNLAHREGDDVVKVLDFGVAKLTPRAGGTVVKTLTLTGAVIGTPTYMAPERLEGMEYDGRSDVYSVGIMLYEMLAGRTPFSSTGDNMYSLISQQISRAPDPITSFTPSVPSALQAIVMTALAKTPPARPTAEELAVSLQRFCESENMV